MVVGAAVLAPGAAVVVALLLRATPPAASPSPSPASARHDLPHVHRDAAPKPGTDQGSPPPARRSWNLAFDDEFGGTTLDTQKWRTCYDWDCTNRGNTELEWYRAQNVTVANGLAQLTATATPTHGMPYASALIQTNGYFDFCYGYAEIRTRLPRGAGLWPAFWLIPQDHSWPPEIDVFESRGDKQTMVSENLFITSDTTPYFISGPDFTAGYHTFGLDWEPHTVTWYIDGKLVRRVEASISKPLYLVANLAVAGNPGPTAETVFPASMGIDFVRVYQHPGSTCAAGNS